MASWSRSVLRNAVFSIVMRRLGAVYCLLRGLKFYKAVWNAGGTVFELELKFRWHGMYDGRRYLVGTKTLNLSR